MKHRSIPAFFVRNYFRSNDPLVYFRKPMKRYTLQFSTIEELVKITSELEEASLKCSEVLEKVLIEKQIPYHRLSPHSLGIDITYQDTKEMGYIKKLVMQDIMRLFGKYKIKRNGKDLPPSD